MLLRENWPAEKLHGQQEQIDRLDALKMLQDYKCRILVSTDLAARGIDASNVDLVINFEPPYEWQTYLHRIGRAGRFGSNGIAVTILSEGRQETDFKTMIKSINGLILKNFWDEENLDLHVSPPELLLQNIENNDAYHGLIDKLTNGDAKCTDETESFETLCNSFAQAKESDIESFNDLLTCFKSHKENDSDPTTANNVNAETNTECLPTLKMLNNTSIELYKNTEIEGTIKKLKDHITHTKDSKKLKKGRKQQKKPDKTETNFKSHNKTIMNGLPKPKEEILIDNGLYDYESDESVLNKALLDAGLPTSFQSSKFSNNIKPKKTHSTYSNYHKNKQLPQKSNNIKKEVGNKNKPPLREQQRYNKQENEKYTSEESETDSSCIIYSKETIKNRNRNSKSNKVNNRDRRHVKLSDDEVENDYSYSKYVIWYNQLKTHIEQIRMALYIEELSKM